MILAGIAVALGAQLRKSRAQALAAFAGRAEAVAVREALEARIERGHRFLDALGESTSDALVLLDENRQVVWANAAAAELFNGGESPVGPVVYRPRA